MASQSDQKIRKLPSFTPKDRRMIEHAARPTKISETPTHCPLARGEIYAGGEHELHRQEAQAPHFVFHTFPPPWMKIDRPFQMLVARRPNETEGAFAPTALPRRKGRQQTCSPM